MARRSTTKQAARPAAVAAAAAPATWAAQVEDVGSAVQDFGALPLAWVSLLGLRAMQWPLAWMTGVMDMQAAFVRQYEASVRMGLEPAVEAPAVGVGSVQALERQWAEGWPFLGAWTEASKIWLDALEHDVRA